jgi:integrase
VPLVRTGRTLPRILEPGQVDALLAALRTRQDRAMAEAMVLGGLRRCEVLGLRLADVQVAARRVFIACGKGGHQRQIPVSGRFFASLAAYLQIVHSWGSASRPGVYSMIARELGQQPLNWMEARAKYGMDAAFQGACRELLEVARTRQVTPLFDGVLIDEAQDLPPEFFQLVYLFH